MVKQSIGDVRRRRLSQFLPHLLGLIRRPTFRHDSWGIFALLENGPKPFWFLKDEKSLSKARQARQTSKQSE